MFDLRLTFGCSWCFSRSAAILALYITRFCPAMKRKVPTDIGASNEQDALIDRPLVTYGVISLILGAFALSVIGPLTILLLLFGPVFVVLGLFAKAPEKPREEEPAPEAE